MDIFVVESVPEFVAMRQQEHPSDQSGIDGEPASACGPNQWRQSEALSIEGPGVYRYSNHLSNIAQTAWQESVETAAQTSKEANGGDLQAKRLLTKEAAQQVKK